MFSVDLEFNFFFSFYRFVLEPELQFATNGQVAAGPIAKFSRIPTSPLFTQNMQVK